MRFLILTLLLLASPADAQLADLLPGSRLRVESTALPSRIEGTLMSHEGAALVIAHSGALRTIVPTPSVTRVRVSHGKSHATGAVKGIKVGAIVGGVVTALLVFSMAGMDTDGEDIVGLGSSMAMAGASYGAIIGVIVGAEKWTTVYQTPYKLDARP